MPRKHSNQLVDANDVYDNQKEKRGSVGGNHNKPLNHFVRQKRIKLRNDKLARLDWQLDQQRHEQERRERDEYFAPVDKHDARNMRKMQNFVLSVCH